MRKPTEDARPGLKTLHGLRGGTYGAASEVRRLVVKGRPTEAWLRAGIEADVRGIAAPGWFDTDAAVTAEVERRLAGIEHTRARMAEVAAWKPRK